MAVTSAELVDVAYNSAIRRYRVTLTNDIVVSHHLDTPKRIIIERKGRKTRHRWEVLEPIRTDRVGEDVLREVNYLLRNKMLPYARTRAKRRKSSRPRDVQKSKLYAAEKQVSAWKQDMLGDLSEVRYYVQRITQSAWWRNRYPDIPYITVNPSKARGGHANAKKRRIVMPEHTWHPMYILHEMAHITNDHLVWKGKQAHGPEYCLEYLTLVEHVLGHDIARELQHSMTRGGVVFARSASSQ